MGFPEVRKAKTALIDQSADADLSEAAALDAGYTARAVITDAAWDTQDMSFQVSADGSNYFPLYYQGSQYKITGAVASRAYALDFNAFYPWRWLKIASGVNQGDDTTITIVEG